jgi:PRC-barrel domain
MLRSLRDLENYEIGATDGGIGHIKDFFFDDHAWVIRYLVVETGNWLSSKKVLISPISIHQPDWSKKMLPVSITKEQVRNSPDIDTHMPVSRQHETDYFDYYGYPFYWTGDGLWGDAMYPYAMLANYKDPAGSRVYRDTESREIASMIREAKDGDDPYLRSCQEVIGYHIEATDGEIGHVAGLLVDEQTWAIRYVVVNTSNWWVGHQVLIAPQWITDVSWANKRVVVGVARQAIKTAPDFDSTWQLNREQEAALYNHHGRRGYWIDA